jgi:hypothetical protein
LMIDVCVVCVVGSRGLLRHLVHDLIYIKINKMATFFPSIPCAYSGVTWSLTFPFYQTIRWRTQEIESAMANLAATTTTATTPTTMLTLNN